MDVYLSHDLRAKLTDPGTPRAILIIGTRTITRWLPDQLLEMKRAHGLSDGDMAMINRYLLSGPEGYEKELEDQLWAT